VDGGLMELRTIEGDENAAFDRAVMTAFHTELSDEDAAMYGQLTAPERQWVWDDAGRIVATAASFRRTLTVPGATVPAAAVTAVGVHPTHRRRGLLTALMRRQLEQLHEGSGEPVAMLWASEAAIYARFGYGPATRAAHVQVDLARAALVDGLEGAPGPAEVVAPGDVLDALRVRYERVRGERPGMVDREDAWWRLRLHDPERRREGAGPLRAAVVEDGYALYAVRAGFATERGQAVVRELVAATPAAVIALWRFLLGLDLVGSLSWRLAAPDEPLQYMLQTLDALELAVGDGLWLRLVDVPAALRARVVAGRADVVLAVSDAFCPWNEGRVTLDGTPTDARADLALDVVALAAAYLGGASFVALAAAGRVRELTPGAAAAAARAWATPRAPWCPEVF
jgi:predicted acetyltransferase